MMLWLREKSRGAASLALLAMALQFFATFGHVHLLEVSASPALVKSLAISKSATVQVAQAVADAAGTADNGASLPGADGDVLCLLCMVSHLVGAGVASSAPLLAWPVAYVRRDPSPLVSADSTSHALTSFWSRGPPIS